jgi:DNA-binding NarL/FixJ family response regulator
MVEGGTHGSAQAAPVQVVAFDDHPVCATGLRVTMGEAGDRVQLSAVLGTVAELDVTLPAHVALLEVRLRDGSLPRDNVATLVAAGMSVIVYTDTDDVRLLSEAVGAGASGVVLKHQSAEVLLEAIRTVQEGGSYLPDEVRQRLADGESARPRLSAREVEVLNLLYQGLITKQAARRLQVSESTVKEHLKRIRQKYTALDRPVSTRVQLLQVAHRDGFITADGVPDEE